MAIDTEERTPAKGGGKGSSSNKKVLIIVLSIVGALILLGIAGTVAAGYFLKEAAEETFETATGGQFDINSDGTGGYTLKGDNGETSTVTTGAELPEGFPSEVPVYDNAKIVSSSSHSSGEDGKLYSVVLVTQDSPQQVYDFYKQAFSTNGWETVSTRSGGLSSVKANHETKQLYGSASMSPSSGSDSKTSVVLGAKTNFKMN